MKYFFIMPISLLSILSSPLVMYQFLIEFRGRADAYLMLDADGYGCTA